jgi:hypothetical protein
MILLWCYFLFFLFPPSVDISLTQGSMDFPKNVGVTPKFYFQKCAMKQTPYLGPQIFRCHHTKFSHLGDMPRVLSPLVWSSVVSHQILLYNVKVQFLAIVVIQVKYLLINVSHSVQAQKTCHT